MGARILKVVQHLSNASYSGGSYAISATQYQLRNISYAISATQYYGQHTPDWSILVQIFQSNIVEVGIRL